MLVRVFEIPPPTGTLHFHRGEDQAFVEVDWFRDDHGMMLSEEGRDRARQFIMQKRYFDPLKAYLVLHPLRPITIGYDPDAQIAARRNASDGGTG